MQATNILITNDFIQAIAIKLWNIMVRYQGQQQLNFSNGWVNNFKKRN